MVRNYCFSTAEHSRAQVEKQITELENGRYRIACERSNTVSAIDAIPKKILQMSDRFKVLRHLRLSLFVTAATIHIEFKSTQDAVDLVISGCYSAKVGLT